MGRLIQSGRLRAVVFALVTIVTAWGALASLPWLGLLGEPYAFLAMADGSRTWDQLFSDRAFAVSLAGLIAATAVGLAVGYLAWTSLIVLGLRFGPASRAIRSTADTDKAAFALNQPTIARALEQDRLVGRALKRYLKTLTSDNDGCRATHPPQGFLTAGLLRERLPALALMPSLPGYFVGLGLLLTFIGIVIALGKASSTVGAADSSAALVGLRGLLDSASFKFSTSIAGLAASLLLSIVFRGLTLWIERALGGLCHAVEDRVTLVTPQELNLEIAGTLKLQERHLAEINGDGFFRRLGEQAGAAVEGAMARAMMPIAQQFESVGESLRRQSEEGLSEMARAFGEHIQGGAGAEMQRTAETLGALQVTLGQVQDAMSSAGASFSGRLDGAAGDLAERLAAATTAMEVAARENRETLSQALSALEAGFARANAQVTGDLAGAASGAGELLRAAMAEAVGEIRNGVAMAVGRMQDTIEAMNARAVATDEAAEASGRLLGESLVRTASATGERLAATMAEAGADVRATIGAATAGMRQAIEAMAARSDAAHVALAESEERLRADTAASAERTAQTLSAAVASVGEEMRATVERLTRELTHAVETTTVSVSGRLDDMGRKVALLNGAIERTASGFGAFAGQGEALARHASETAGRFQMIAGDVQRAAEPIRLSTERLADGVARAGETIAASGRAAAEHHEAARSLAEELRAHSERVRTVWEAYRERFENVDGQLAHAFEELGNQLAQEHDAARRFVGALDESFDKAIRNLNGTVQGFRETADDMVDAAGTLTRALGGRTLSPALTGSEALVA